MAGDRLTDEQIAELERLERAAASAPWGVSERLRLTPDEKILCIAARNALPSLLAEVRASRSAATPGAEERTLERWALNRFLKRMTATLRDATQEEWSRPRLVTALTSLLEESLAAPSEPPATPADPNHCASCGSFIGCRNCYGKRTVVITGGEETETPWRSEVPCPSCAPPSGETAPGGGGRP